MGKEYKVRRYGYDRHRQRKRRAWRTVLFVALLAGACVAAWFLYEPVVGWLEQQNAIYAQKRQEQQAEKERLEKLKLEQEQKEQEQQGELPPSDDPVTPPVEETPQQLSFPQRTAILTAAELTNAAKLEGRLQELAAAGYDGILFDIKDDTGLVLYQSALEAVTGNQKQTAARYDLAAVVAACEKADLTPVGRLVAFRDGIAGRVLADATVKYNYTKTNWLDNDSGSGGKTWLNPNSTIAQDYILALLEEAMEQGLHRIVLDGVQFPTGYSLELATYAPKGVAVDRSAVLAAFVGRAAEAAQQKEAALWNAVQLADLLKAGGRYGDTPKALLAAKADGLVLDINPEQLLARREKLPEQPSEKIGPALAGLPELNNGQVWVATVQAYAPARSIWSYAQPFGQPQVDDQAAVAAEYGAVGIIEKTKR